MHAKFFTSCPDYSEELYVIKKFKHNSHPHFYCIETISFVSRNEEIGIELACKSSYYANSLGHKILHMRHMLDLDCNKKQEFDLVYTGKSSRLRMVGNLSNAFYVLKLFHFIDKAYAEKILNHSAIQNVLESSADFEFSSRLKLCEPEEILLNVPFENSSWKIILDKISYFKGEEAIKLYFREKSGYELMRRHIELILSLSQDDGADPIIFLVKLHDTEQTMLFLEGLPQALEVLVAYELISSTVRWHILATVSQTALQDALFQQAFESSKVYIDALHIKESLRHKKRFC